MSYPTVGHVLLVDMDTEEKFTVPVTTKMVILNQVYLIRETRKKLERQARETDTEKKLYHGMTLSIACAEFILRTLLITRRLEIKARRNKC